MEKHVQLTGVLWIVYGAMSLLGGFIAFGVLFGLSFIPDMGHEGPIILRSVGIGVGLLLLVLSIPKIIAGIGLLRKKEWARILTLVVAFISLLSFPLGTALAVYSIVILLKDDTIQLFKPRSR